MGILTNFILGTMFRKVVASIVGFCAVAGVSVGSWYYQNKATHYEIKYEEVTKALETCKKEAVAVNEYYEKNMVITQAAKKRQVKIDRAFINMEPVIADKREVVLTNETIAVFNDMFRPFVRVQ